MGHGKLYVEGAVCRKRSIPKTAWHEPRLNTETIWFLSCPKSAPYFPNIYATLTLCWLASLPGLTLGVRMMGAGKGEVYATIIITYKLFSDEDTLALVLIIDPNTF